MGWLGVQWAAWFNWPRATSPFVWCLGLFCHCSEHPVSDGIDGHAHQRPDQRLSGFSLDEVNTDGAATVSETVVPTGAFVPPPHSHDGFEETIYVQRGTFTVTIDGTSQEIGAGHAAFIGRGQVHSFDNSGGVDGAFLSVASPGIFRTAYFLEIDEVLTASPDGSPQ
jgi:quercetin dioxygenase-like cupin family protein